MSEHDQRPHDHLVEPMISGLKRTEAHRKKSVPAWKLLVALLVLAALVWIVYRQSY